MEQERLLRPRVTSESLNKKIYHVSDKSDDVDLLCNMFAMINCNLCQTAGKCLPKKTLQSIMGGTCD
jgi:hypothetical protein